MLSRLWKRPTRLVNLNAPKSIDRYKSLVDMTISSDSARPQYDAPQNTNRPNSRNMTRILFNASRSTDGYKSLVDMTISSDSARPRYDAPQNKNKPNSPDMTRILFNASRSADKPKFRNMYKYRYDAPKNIIPFGAYIYPFNVRKTRNIFVPFSVARSWMLLHSNSFSGKRDPSTSPDLSQTPSKSEKETGKISETGGNYKLSNDSKPSNRIRSHFKDTNSVGPIIAAFRKIESKISDQKLADEDVKAAIEYILNGPTNYGYIDLKNPHHSELFYYYVQHIVEHKPLSQVEGLLSRKWQIDKQQSPDPENTYRVVYLRGSFSIAYRLYCLQKLGALDPSESLIIGMAQPWGNERGMKVIPIRRIREQRSTGDLCTRIYSDYQRGPTTNRADRSFYSTAAFSDSRDRIKSELENIRVKTGHTRVYRGVKHAFNPLKPNQVSEALREKLQQEQKIPNFVEGYLFPFEARKHAFGVSHDGVSVTTHYETAKCIANKGQCKHFILAFDVPNDTFNRLPEGDPIQAEKVFKGHIPNTFFVGYEDLETGKVYKVDKTGKLVECSNKSEHK